jgi:DNA-binding NtrC family response regulator
MDVLLIDDEKPFLKDLAEGLSLYSNKLQVITADNAKKALEMINTAVIDVVVTDLNMPGMNGFELLAQLQRIRPDVPFIIMSANTRASVEDLLKGLRIFKYLEKPLDLREIAEVILSCPSRAEKGTSYSTTY